MSEEEPKKTMVSRVAERAKQRSEWSIPHWAMVVGAILIVGTLAGLSYGAVQHFRVKRWEVLLKEARKKIEVLEGEKELIRLQTTRELGTKAINMSKEKIAKVDEAIKKLKEKEKKIVGNVKAMPIEDLLNEFRKEGFGGAGETGTTEQKEKTVPVKEKTGEHSREKGPDSGCGGCNE